MRTRSDAAKPCLNDMPYIELMSDCEKVELVLSIRCVSIRFRLEISFFLARDNVICSLLIHSRQSITLLTGG